MPPIASTHSGPHRGRPAPRVATAFTLVELLVVVTIIALLLALLTPALDAAIYQAELAVCGSNMRALGTSVNVYAADHRRRYPHRPAVHAGTPSWQPILLNNAGINPLFDERPVYRGYLVNGMLNDPLATGVDLIGSEPDSVLMANLNLWFGYRYAGHRGMLKLGDRFGWQASRFRALASDMDHLYQNIPAAIGGHPDRDGRMTNLVWQDRNDLNVVGLGVGNQWTYSRWQWSTDHRRGPIDMNVVGDDLAVARYGEVRVDDPRLTSVPVRLDGGSWPQIRTFIPEE